jgi:hypothetical protein
MKSIAIASIVYALLFVLWRRFHPEGIVFYQGVLLAAMVAIAQFAAVSLARAGNVASRLKDSVFSFLLLYCLVFTVPTTVDRAYSVRMILEIENSGAGLTREEIEHWFATDFQAQGGVQKRLQEQLVTGSLVQRGERFQLTSLGHFLAASFRWMQWLFNTTPSSKASPAGKP